MPNPQEIITNDNLNAKVDAQVYFRIKSDEMSVKQSQYNVNRIECQIVNLAGPPCVTSLARSR